MQLKIYNSLSREIEPFKPVTDNIVKIYSCGPTVYNHAHIGNMRAFLFADLVQRVTRVVGNYEVHWVMNLTDIDDKTIRDSRKGSDRWLEEMGAQTENPIENLKLLTEYYQDAFFEDISLLGINLEHFFAIPAATDFIEEMQDLIRRIVENGFGYVAQGSVYFDVTKWRQADIYGKLFKIDFENFREGVRIDADEYERESVSDFVLWKNRKEDEPFWDFELNGENLPGRPGWHIECSAMEYNLLGLPFDIHTGGVDLKFPHHEDEIAQSKAGYGVEPTNFWLHNEFLEVEGEKMSKSAGNFFTIQDLVAKNLDTLDIRFAMLSAHYRTKYNFTFGGVESAHKARKRIQDYIYDLLESDGSGSEVVKIGKLKDNIFTELANDFHTPKALAHIFTFINNNPAAQLDSIVREHLITLFRELNEIFAVWDFGIRPVEELVIPREVMEFAEQRWQAKQSRDFANADSLRKKIDEMGFVVKDSKDGYEVMKK